jgi:Cu+-exporting ATPase
VGDTSLIIQEKCFHCGNDINNDRLTYNGLSFCCQGCASVYAVLKKYGMTDYYHYKHGTSKRIKQELEPQYDFLEDESIKNSLLEFKSNNLEQLRLYIPQIHCTACVWLLEKLNKLSSGIKRSEVDFLRKELFIAYNPQEIHLKEVISLISRLGYEPSLSLEDIQKKDGRKEPSYELWYKIGVVGFCFGNIMLLSFPEYLGIDAKKETQFTLFFGILNTILWCQRLCV